MVFSLRFLEAISSDIPIYLTIFAANIRKGLFSLFWKYVIMSLCLRIVMVINILYAQRTV